MNKIDLYDLRHLESAPEDLFLPRGQKILNAGHLLNDDIFNLIEKSGVEHLYAVAPQEQELFKFDAINTAISVDSEALKKEGTLNQSLYDERGRLILKEGESWTQSHAHQLRKESIKTLYLRRSNKKISEDQIKAEKLIQAISAVSSKSDTQLYDHELTRHIEEYEQATSDTFSIKGIDQLSLKLGNDITPDTLNALKDELEQRDHFELRSSGEKEKLKRFQKNSVRQLRSLCQALISGHDGNTSDLVNLTKEMISAYIYDKEFLLLINHLENKTHNNDFILRHNINRAVVTMQIATNMGYSAKQVFELSFGSLLHDIGMLKVPKHIVLKKGPLTQDEKLEIFKHPIYSLNMLQKLPGIPMTTPLIAYQCHERGDCSGYPQRRRLKIINKFSRITMLADIYCALINPRPHRKAYTPDQAMLFLSDEADAGRIDKRIFQAFLDTNTFYPVGTWVVLSDDHIGRVVATNRGQLKAPVVRTYYKRSEALKAFGTIDLSEEVDLEIKKTFDGNRLKIDALAGV